MKKVHTIFLGMLIFSVLASFLFTKAQELEMEAQMEPVPIPALTYHRIISKASSIYDYTPEQLEGHLQYLKEHGYTPITALEMVEMLANPGQLPEKPVVLTFDDGHKSHYTTVFPLLKKFGYRATFFVYTDVIAEKSEKQLTWDELRTMSREGMDIQSHTKSHPRLTQAKKNESQAVYLKRLQSEIQGSKGILEEKLEQEVDILAYPYGWFNQTIETMAVEAGYRGIFTVNWGVNSLTENPLRIKRRVMENTMGPEELNQILTAAPLPIEIIQPEDSARFGQAPVIKFKTADPRIDRVEIKVRSVIGQITKDQDGFFTWSGLERLFPGYHMIIIKGFDQENQPFINSWGFDYQR
ncbi:MAG: polysaccharide deacetylase family protein [Bacteroidota bacterium]